MSRIGIVGMFATALALGACDSATDIPGGQPGTGKPGNDNPPQHQQPAAVIFEGYSPPVLAGDTVRLRVRALDAAGTEIALPVVWSSADTALATITPDGLMTPRVGGVARINATVGSYPAHVDIAVKNRAAVLEEVTPGQVMLGSGPVVITLRGRNFVPGATAVFGKYPLPTIRVSDTELRAEIPAQHLQFHGEAKVTVLNPVSEGPSQELPFAIERNPLVTTTYRLVGADGRGAVPVEIGRSGFRHWQTGVVYEEVIRTITAGRLIFEERQGEDTQFIQYSTETITDVATGQVVYQSELIFFGYLEYDMFDGSIIFVSGGLPFSLRGAFEGANGVTLKQNLGGTELTWRYVKQ